MNNVKELKKKSEDAIVEYEEDTINKIVDVYFDEILDKYKDIDDIYTFLLELKEDFSDEIGDITNKETDKKEDDIKELISGLTKEDKDLPKKYEVNLLVDNSKTEGAPVIYSGNPNFNNIVGRVEYENELGNLVTDFTNVQAGLLHQANGGYLILNVIDVLSNHFVWEFLKKSLMNNKIEIENIREKLGGIPLKTVIPEAVPLNVKVILIGNNKLFQLLYEYDSEFKKIFKVHVQLDYEMKVCSEAIENYMKYIGNYIKENSYLNMSVDAKYKLIYYASKLAGNKNKLSTKVSLIEDVIVESNYCAKKNNEKVITENCIKKVLDDREKRLSFVKDKMYEMISNNKINIELEGKVTGQINGLAVVSFGEYYFGKPSRITATSYVGQNGMINIEKEVGLSGAIHDKGANILVGYLGQKFAQNQPLCLSCRVCFEQSYSGIDGDSASSTELYAILSSLSEIPIKQYIAVTGSVDQMGNIQAVGGISEKVEGFYRVCKNNNLSKKQGVIIPKINVDELILSDEVLESIEKGEFHIYAIEKIEEGMKVLTDCDFEIISEKVKEKLNDYSSISNKKSKI